MGGGEASVKGGEKRAAGGAKENLRSGQGINKYSNINETAKKLETELQEKSGRSLEDFQRRQAPLSHRSQPTCLPFPLKSWNNLRPEERIHQRQPYQKPQEHQAQNQKHQVKLRIPPEIHKEECYQTPFDRCNTDGHHNIPWSRYIEPGHSDGNKRQKKQSTCNTREQSDR